MKKKGNPTNQNVTATKRKHEDVGNGAVKLKKRKKQDQNENLSSPKKIKNNLSSPKKIKNNLSSPKKIKNKQTLQTTYAVVKGPINAEAATSKELKIKKKKKKKKQLGGIEELSSSSEIANVVNSDVKKKGKKMRSKLNQATLNVSPPNDTTVINSDFKKKKKNTLSQDTLNASVALSDTTAVNSDVKKKKKKKKKNKLNQDTLNASAALSDTTAVNSDVKKKKKKKKNKLNQGTSVSDGNRGFSPKSLQKNTKSKPFKNEKKALPEGEGSILEKQNQTNMKGLVKPKFSKNKNKSKLDKPQGMDEEKGTNKAQAKSQNKHISRLINFKNKQEGLLSKASGTKEKKKIELRIRKIEQQVQKLRSGLGNQATKTNTTEVVNQRVFRGLPQDPPPAMKKHKRVELNEFLQNQLKASRFRWLNENLYTSSSEEAQTFFKEDPGSFKAYHEGYSEQVAKWPVNPVDVIINELQSMPRGTVVADLGCGEAKLAAGLPHLKVHSLDFIALKPEVTACDMAHCPLLRSSVDVAVFCLSLMGTNVSDFLLEANRILKTGGTMEIAEVESRFESIDDFIENVHKYGFQLKKKSPTDMFFFLTFRKTQDVSKSGKLPHINLKACIYKKR